MIGTTVPSQDRFPRCVAQVLLAAVAALTLAACGSGIDGQGGALAAGTTRLSGTVTYREKVALPPDAKVEVRLEESTQGTPPVTVAMQIFDSAGRQVPIPFTLEVNRDVLKGERMYALAATIRSQSGEVLYASTDDETNLSSPNTTARIEIFVHPVRSSSAQR
ncbi:MAG: YbaY family lipoprotein [Gammaproteobacteria bacterium]